ncbi:YggS family pyridoxal phosphate-dependent enzyme [Rhodocaloribacter litoris]|uniref:YggS family pyridoxal phosphate-dependent enzyme n=1 Tax=Rhodocaloribacter litoris TaxID=2558931 RepID=UPI0014203BEF|nr:YggS family pyridoxal phosphate-dependent enzyme [Rhodocaloribacter litoris]QXD14824.1 YggS family pyridoxal phosphate-dependent enzyme [Rhodocaloribacter litoris]
MYDDTVVDERAIAAAVAAVRARIERACRRAGRSPDEVTLIGVTKTFPVEAVAAARAAGLEDFGENKVQELVEKAGRIPGALHGGPVRWHMIGHLQRNKARDVVRHADVFHALDSRRLAEALERRAADAGRVLPCFVQVNVSGEPSKFGLDPGAVHPFLDALAACEHLHVVGLMTLAAPADDPEDVRPQFRLLRRLLETYDARDNPQVDLRYLSMGMTGDFEVAVEEGATHVRIGTALFGAREAP